MQPVVKVEFALSSETLGALASLVPGGTTPVSPLSIGGDRVLSQGEMASLQRLGVVGANGAVTGMAQRTLSGLARPSAYAEIRLLCASGYFEHVLYFSPEGRPILMSTVGKELVVRDPAPVEELTLLVRQHMGESLLKSTEFSVDLPYPEALALAAAIDLQRRAFLRALADDLFPVAISFKAEQLADAMASSGEGMQWLAGLMRLLRDTGEATSVAAIQHSLAALVGSGQLVAEGETFRLSDNGLELASRLLAIQNVLLLGAGRVSAGGTGVQANQLCLQAGLHDLLTVETLGARVQFASTSAAELLAYLEQFLTDPAVLPLPTTSTPARRRCSSCGAGARPEDRFCPGCGAPLLAPSAAACPSCGTAAKSDQNFCPKCGSKLR